MEEQDGQIDETMPGSDFDGADGVGAQLTIGDTLLDRGLQDPLDEGYSPPDYPSSVDVPTEAEEARGASLDELLAAEVPDVGADDTDGGLFDESGEFVGDERSGRLVSTDDGGAWDTEKDLVAGDVGIDGAGASAEEAAVHVIEDDDR